MYVCMYVCKVKCCGLAEMTATKWLSGSQQSGHSLLVSKQINVSVFV